MGLEAKVTKPLSGMLSLLCEITGVCHQGAEALSCNCWARGFYSSLLLQGSKIRAPCARAAPAWEAAISLMLLFESHHLLSEHLMVLLTAVQFTAGLREKYRAMLLIDKGTSWTQVSGLKTIARECPKTVLVTEMHDLSVGNCRRHL